ncbi:hypothetical protein GW17_00059798, partial [Ensete ventricosum]
KSVRKRNPIGSHQERSKTGTFLPGLRSTTIPQQQGTNHLGSETPDATEHRETRFRRSPDRVSKGGRRDAVLQSSWNARSRYTTPSWWADDGVYDGVEARDEPKRGGGGGSGAVRSCETAASSHDGEGSVTYQYCSNPPSDGDLTDKFVRLTRRGTGGAGPRGLEHVSGVHLVLPILIRRLLVPLLDRDTCYPSDDTRKFSSTDGAPRRPRSGFSDVVNETRKWDSAGGTVICGGIRQRLGF